ncbi:hypothetical protein G5I_13771 [Acromyrmex echinatior]|uniref:Secreted protein n=1 Tax=Acromyrmex echinatior TaxID=103372 RepID=F4X5X8_ACREC|nr:hypothetical protein G5I_13771 [Acromyrmex echinatior]
MTIITAVFVPWTVWIFVTLVHSSEDRNKNNADEKNKRSVLRASCANFARLKRQGCDCAREGGQFEEPIWLPSATAKCKTSAASAVLRTSRLPTRPQPPTPILSLQIRCNQWGERKLCLVSPYAPIPQRVPGHTYVTYRRRIAVTTYDELTAVTISLAIVSSIVSRVYFERTVMLFGEHSTSCPPSFTFRDPSVQLSADRYLALLLEPKDPANDFLTNDRFETIASSSTSTTMNGLPRRRQKSPFSQLCSE